MYPADYTPTPHEDIESGVEMKSGTTMADASPNGKLQPSKFQMSLSTRKVAQDLKWMNVDFKVKDKQILKDCWGQVPSGSICAIMGGSGKDSFDNRSHLITDSNLLIS